MVALLWWRIDTQFATIVNSFSPSGSTKYVWTANFDLSWAEAKRVFFGMRSETNGRQQSCMKSRIVGKLSTHREKKPAKTKLFQLCVRQCRWFVTSREFFSLLILFSFHDFDLFAFLGGNHKTVSHMRLWMQLPIIKNTSIRNVWKAIFDRSKIALKIVCSVALLLTPFSIVCMLMIFSQA